MLGYYGHALWVGVIFLGAAVVIALIPIVYAWVKRYDWMKR